MNRPLIFMLAAAAIVVVSTAQAAPIDINGGSSWGGWTDRGSSLDVGIWGAGSTTRSYELYTTSFTFNNNTFDSSTGGTQVKAVGTPAGFAAGAFSTGAFANGNTIIGIGLDLNGSANAAGTTFVSFGLRGNEFQAASSLGAGDGRVDGSVYSYSGDFAVWMDSVSGNGPSNLAVYKTDGTGYGGSADITNLVGGFGSGVSYDFAFRQFRNGTTGGAIQMFFDLTAMQSLYNSSGANYITTGWNNGLGSIGPIGSNISFAMYNSDAGFVNANRVAFGVAVPEPSALVLVSLGVIGGCLIARGQRKTTS